MGQLPQQLDPHAVCALDLQQHDVRMIVGGIRDDLAELAGVAEDRNPSARASRSARAPRTGSCSSTM